MAGQSTSEDAGNRDDARDRGENRERSGEHRGGVPALARGRVETVARCLGHRARRRRLPAPSAHGLAAARGRDARALRRTGLAAGGDRARDAGARRRAAPLPARLGGRAPRVRARGPPARLGALRGREPAARGAPRAPAGRPHGGARLDPARRAELALSLPRRLRPDVQRLPLLLPRLLARPAARARARWPGSLGAVGRDRAPDGRDAPVRRAAARGPGAPTSSSRRASA